MTKDLLSELVELEKKATPGPWEYGGMCGDPGKPLRHFMEAASFKKGNFLFLSEPFNIDYSGMESDFKFIAALRNAFPAIKSALESLDTEMPEMSWQVARWLDVNPPVKEYIDKLAAHCAGLRRDAERYRWLRSRACRMPESIVVAQTNVDRVDTTLADDELDAAIDAARSLIAPPAEKENR